MTYDPLKNDKGEVDDPITGTTPAKVLNAVLNKDGDEPTQESKVADAQPSKKNDK